MSDNLDSLNDWASGLLDGLSDRSRKALAGKIAQDLRAVSQARITAQTEPDGTPFVPRKPQIRNRGTQKRARNKLMFKKLRLNKNLRVQSTVSAAVVEFAEGVQRIAQVHHHGLRDRVQKGNKGPDVKYDARPLLGITDSDAQRISDLILGHLSR